MKKYYSIRVVEANSLDEAINAIMDEEFCEDDELCDAVLTKKQAYESFNKICRKKKGDVGLFLTSGKTGDVMYTEKSDANITSLASVYGVRVKTERMYALTKENAGMVENLVKITIL